MKVNLPSGGWAELRDKLLAKDKFSVQNAISVPMDNRGQIRDVSGSVMTLMETALMTRLLESWSLDDPLPGSHSCPECMGNSALWHQHVADYIGETLELDDFNALETIISPMLDKVMAVPNLGTSSG